MQQKPTRRRIDSAKPALPTGKILICVLVVALIAMIAVVLVKPSEETSASTSQNHALDRKAVRFVAVGDNLPEETLGYYADSYSGSIGDGLYDYSPFYEPIKPYIQAADLAYVKQEVHLDDSIGVHGYPSFNAPESLAQDLVSLGFNMIGSASNHIYDWGYFGACERNREVWNAQNVCFAGSNNNEEEAHTIACIEKNGIRFAFLDYTYGVNGYSESDLSWYEVNYISEERIKNDVTLAHECADVVIVAMHWGIENQTSPSEFQLTYAQLLADLEVDIVLGSHPHVIGDVSWVEGQNGNKTLVCYSLGNFLSHHAYPEPDNELEGMISCTFVPYDDGSIGIEDVVFTPLVNHTDDSAGVFAVYAVKDYSNELARSAAALSRFDDALQWLHDETYAIVGTDIRIDDGFSAA